MGLNNVVGSASRVVPLVIRASAGIRWYSQRHYSSVLCATVDGRVRYLSRSTLQWSFPSFLHQYSTEASSESSDGPLLEALSEEIHCAVASHAEDPGEEVPEGFPFKIEDHHGTDSIILTRDYRGETISVEVHMPNLVTGYDEGDSNKISVPLVVKTSKKGGPYLEFGCTAYPDEVVIDSLSLKDPEISEEQIAYLGPDFGDLDENLQKAFHQYLAKRGIKPSTTNYLHAYMIEKDTRGYLEWLRKVESFLKA